ncbi:maleylpyruvate isomerase N-terminal domain-containing protein [Paractinoplanes hotanensis]|uniref:Maleylpyruvate isomerase N-terminal domain-containing protein n=1 Tax=Paractinoplanes hotanensis TaxID=2906497 RepID=A0ABT0YAR9_9ACTN|nr:maleylpyruvate isomerase N-terminal domain-containing protein [Actinoplanes hotanensis]MCM4083126.1 maleylpyruvate isomerase N-terminal domain-containing protein [Actinoplanes hotanensis]
MTSSPVALPLPAQDHLRALAEEMDAFATIAAKADLGLPVAIHRSWGLGGLVGHLGSIHRWAAENVRTGKRSRAPKPDHDDMARWYRESADILLDRLAATDPDSPCWNFSVVPRTAAFWFRRQLHETTIHGRDADLAIGPARPVDAAIAADGVDEVLRVMLAVGHRWDGRPLPALTGPILVSLTDTGHGWLLSPSDRPVPDVTGPMADVSGVTPVTTLSGTAEQVLLTLWQRVPFAETPARVEGDDDLLRRLLRAQITP